MSVVRLAEATFDDLDHGRAEICRTECIHERIQPGIDVCQPERGRVQISGDRFRAGETHVEDEVKRGPAQNVRQHYVGQSDERLSTAV